MNPIWSPCLSNSSRKRFASAMVISRPVTYVKTNQSFHAPIPSLKFFNGRPGGQLANPGSFDFIYFF
jgi:hypothetical protein